MNCVRICGACGTVAGPDAKFCSDCGVKLIPPAGGVPGLPIEKHHATILNFDVKDSSKLTRQFDPEDSHQLVYQVIRTVRDIVNRHRPTDTPHYDRVEGDSIMFCFGLPNATEDDAERAASAALEAAAAVSRLRLLPDVALHVRVGMATGEVVVNPRPDGVGLPKPFITGTAANLAARLQSRAQPGGVVVSHESSQLISDRFECEYLAAVRFKGIGRVPCWRLVGPYRSDPPFPLPRPGKAPPVPLVGRKAELDALRRHWATARAGEGRVVLLSGEPGVGKSRLLGEFFSGIRKEGHAAFHFQCSREHQNTALHPVLEGLRRWIRLAPDTRRPDRAASFEAFLTERIHLSSRHAGAICEAMSLKAEPAEALDSANSLKRRHELAEALIALAEARIAKSGGALIVLDDAQWADPSTWELIDALQARIPRWRALLLISHRPELLRPPWVGPHVRRRHLRGLDRRASRHLALLTAGEHHGLSAEVLRLIVQRAEGVPLYVEELTKGILEHPGWRSALDPPQAPGHALEWPIPITLRDLLTARLDRSTDARGVAQIGAVIGRDFDHVLLLTVTGDDRLDVDRGLRDLRESGLLFTRTTPSQVIHAFKHSLVQDVARDSLLRGRRQELHARVARALELRNIPGPQVSPTVLAFHYGEADLPRQAARYSTHAGMAAASRSAYAEARFHLERALDWLKQCEDDPDQLQMDIYTALSQTLIAWKGYASPDVARVFRQVRPLIQADAPISAKEMTMRWWEGQRWIVLGQYAKALRRGIELEQIAVAEGNDENFAHAQMLTGLVHLYVGKIALAKEHLERCVGLDPAHVRLSGKRVEDLVSPSLAYLARAIWLLGQPDRAIACSDRAVELARGTELGLLPTQVTGMRMLVAQMVGDRDRIRTWVDRTLAIAEERDNPYWLRLARVIDTWWYAMDGSRDAAHRLPAVLKTYAETPARVGLSGLMTLVAQASSRCGLHAAAADHVARALAFTKESREAYFLAELHRVKGETLLAGGGRQAAREAEPCFRVAIDIAHRQHALSWQLRSAISLARLWATLDRRQEAVALLDAIYGRFEEGFQTPDLQEARHLLAQLR